MVQNQAKPLLLKNLNVYGENGIIANGFVTIHNGKISEVGPIAQLHHEDSYEKIDLPKGYTLIPGFIDIHIHGVDGADTMDGMPEALLRMSAEIKFVDHMPYTVLGKLDKKQLKSTNSDPSSIQKIK